MVTFPATPRPSTVSKSPIFSTLTVNYGNTIEQRMQLNSIQRYAFDLSYSAKDVGLLDVFVDFFHARKGSYEAFYFQNTAEAYRTVIWATSGSHSVGGIVRPVTPNGRSYICTVGGTSAGSEPTWSGTPNGTVTDGGVTWRENSYTVRFAADSQKYEYFFRSLMNQGTVSFITCSE